MGSSRRKRFHQAEIQRYLGRFPPTPARRPETAVMQFEGDWRGVFIRGDDAIAHFMPALQAVMEKWKPEPGTIEPLYKLTLLGLCELFASAADDDETSAQKMKPFVECLDS